MSRIALILLAALALAGGVTASGADFTASSAAPTTFTAAADFNTVAASLDDPGTNLHGTVTLTATSSSNRGIASVLIQRARTGTTIWTDVCADTTAPYSCPWDTVAAGDGSHDLRVVATDSAGYSRAATRSARVVDNLAPTVSLTNPGANLSGIKTITATASDAGSGVQSITIQHRALGAPTWTDLCAGTTSPRSCNLVTTSLPDGDRELRAIATDHVGRAGQTATTTVRIDNTPPTATGSGPAAGRGNVALTATASDSGSGVAYVTFEGRYLGTWYEFCPRDTTAPYSCSGDSTPIADGTYTLRAVVVDKAGVKSYSAEFSVTIDNTAPAAADIQATNGGATPGLLEAGDAITLTWSEPIAPATVLAGWSGSAQPVRVRVANAAAGDELEFSDSTGTTRLGLVATAADLQLGGDFVTTDAEFDATMALSGEAITVTLGAQRSGTLATAVAGTMTWRPSAAATDLFGNPSSTVLRTETGALDEDF